MVRVDVATNEQLGTREFVEMPRVGETISNVTDDGTGGTVTNVQWTAVEVVSASGKRTVYQPSITVTPFS